MPKTKSRKKTGAKKKSKPAARKRSIKEDSADVPIIPFLESFTENGTTKPEISSKIEVEDFADISEERASIISIVQDLEGQVDTAYQLKEVLEAELNATQKELSEESVARMELEQRLKPLEVQAELAKQLREDISFAEEERNKFADSLAETKQQFKAVTEQRDSLAERTASVETQTKELESERMALEAQVMNLKDKVTDMDRLRCEFDKVKQVRQDLEEQVRDISNRLEASNTAKDTFEKELTESSVQVENLQEKVITAEGQASDLRAQVEQQQVENKDMTETGKRLENEIKTLNVKYETVKNELKAFKEAMHDIRSEVAQTSGRVRQRYFKPSS